MKKRYCIVTIACFFVGCTRFIFSESDETTDFSKYKTYAWHPKSIKPDNEKSLENQVLENNIKSRVNKELVFRSLQTVADSPDVWIDYKITFQKKINQVQSAGSGNIMSSPNSFYNPGFYNYGMGLYPMGYSNRYKTQNVVTEEATITFYVIDRKSGRQIWRGLMADDLKSYEDFESKIYSSIPAIFKKFPPLHQNATK